MTLPTCLQWPTVRLAPTVVRILDIDEGTSPKLCPKSRAAVSDFSYAIALRSPSETIEIYCVKCKAKTGSKDIEAITMKNGRPSTRSICVECGTKKFRIGILP